MRVWILQLLKETASVTLQQCEQGQGCAVVGSSEEGVGIAGSHLEPPS